MELRNYVEKHEHHGMVIVSVDRQIPLSIKDDVPIDDDSLGSYHRRWDIAVESEGSPTLRDRSADTGFGAGADRTLTRWLGATASTCPAGTSHSSGAAVATTAARVLAVAATCNRHRAQRQGTNQSDQEPHDELVVAPGVPGCNAPVSPGIREHRVKTLRLSVRRRNICAWAHAVFLGAEDV
jgi:hypothetical protein